MRQWRRPPLDEKTLGRLPPGAENSTSGLYSWQVERDKCYVERDAFHTNGVLEAHIAASEQSFVLMNSIPLTLWHIQE